MTQQYDRKRKAWVPSKKRQKAAREREAERAADLERFKAKIVPLENRVAEIDGKIDRWQSQAVDLLQAFDNEVKALRKEVRSLASNAPTLPAMETVAHKAATAFLDHDDLDVIMAVAAMPNPSVMPRSVVNRLVEMARAHVRIREMVATDKGRT